MCIGCWLFRGPRHRRELGGEIADCSAFSVRSTDPCGEQARGYVRRLGQSWRFRNEKGASAVGGPPIGLDHKRSLKKVNCPAYGSPVSRTRLQKLPAVWVLSGTTIGNER
jgi:hypothetical protein